MADHDLVTPWEAHCRYEFETRDMDATMATMVRTVSIPMVAVVQSEGDKLVHEHIYWDQPSVLVQLGKLDPHGLPVLGAETARKMLDNSPAQQRADGRRLAPFRGGLNRSWRRSRRLAP